MNSAFSEIFFPSSDGIHTVHAEIYEPTDQKIRGVVQLSHGMVDCVRRYRYLAEDFCARGYVFAGNEHLGHGGTAASADDFGFFAEKNGVDFILRDLLSMNKILKERYPGVPVILLGHSMGSFIARLYTTRYPHTIRALIIHGTGGKNPAVPFGKLIAKAVRDIHGPRYRSKMINRLAFSGYNAHFDKKEGPNAWLTRDASKISDRDTNPYTNFIFTVSGFLDLFGMCADCNKPAWFAAFPKELPVLIVSGDEDPVGAYGKGPTYVYKHLMLDGVQDVTLKLYPGARHELFNETNCEEVFADIAAWIGRFAL